MCLLDTTIAFIWCQEQTNRIFLARYMSFKVIKSRKIEKITEKTNLFKKQNLIFEVRGSKYIRKQLLFVNF